MKKVDMSSYVFSNAIMFLREVSWMAGAGLFTDIDHHQVAALASCFLPVEKSNEQVHLKNELAWPLRKLQDTARKIAEVFFPLFWLVSVLNAQYAVISVSSLNDTDFISIQSHQKKIMWSLLFHMRFLSSHNRYATQPNFIPLLTLHEVCSRPEAVV